MGRGGSTGVAPFLFVRRDTSLTRDLTLHFGRRRNNCECDADSVDAHELGIATVAGTALNPARTFA